MDERWLLSREEGGGWLSLNNEGETRGRGRGSGWLLSWSSGFIGGGSVEDFFSFSFFVIVGSGRGWGEAGVEGGCGMGLGVGA